MGYEFHLPHKKLFLAFSLLNEHLIFEASALSFATICQMANGHIKGQLATLHQGPKQCFGGNLVISWVGMDQKQKEAYSFMQAHTLHWRTAHAPIVF